MRAGTIEPLAYARGLARRGDRRRRGCPHAKPSARGGADRRQWTLRQASGTVVADWVAVATDAYGGAPWPQVRREQIFLPYFNFATAPLDPDRRPSILPGREGCWDTKEIMSYFRFDRAGRLVFGSVGALRGTGLAIHRAWAQRALRKIFPAPRPVEFEHQWYGMIGMTDDNLPRFHRLPTTS